MAKYSNDLRFDPYAMKDKGYIGPNLHRDNYNPPAYSPPPPNKLPKWLEDWREKIASGEEPAPKTYAERIKDDQAKNAQMMDKINQQQEIDKAKKLNATFNPNPHGENPANARVRQMQSDLDKQNHVTHLIKRNLPGYFKNGHYTKPTVATFASEEDANKTVKNAESNPGSSYKINNFYNNYNPTGGVNHSDNSAGATAGNVIRKVINTVLPFKKGGSVKPLLSKTDCWRNCFK